MGQMSRQNPRCKVEKSFAQRGLFFLKYAQPRKAMSNISNRACKNRVPNISSAPVRSFFKLKSSSFVANFDQKK